MYVRTAPLCGTVRLALYHIPWHSGKDGNLENPGQETWEFVGGGIPVSKRLGTGAGSVKLGQVGLR